MRKAARTGKPISESIWGVVRNFALAAPTLRPPAAEQLVRQLARLGRLARRETRKRARPADVSGRQSARQGERIARLQRKTNQSCGIKRDISHCVSPRGPARDVSDLRPISRVAQASRVWSQAGDVGQVRARGRQGSGGAVGDDRAKNNEGGRASAVQAIIMISFLCPTTRSGVGLAAAA